MSDIDTAVVDSLKVLDPKRPIREADMAAHSEAALPPKADIRRQPFDVRLVPSLHYFSASCWSGMPLMQQGMQDRITLL